MPLWWTENNVGLNRRVGGAGASQGQRPITWITSSLGRPRRRRITDELRIPQLQISRNIRSGQQLRFNKLHFRGVTSFVAVSHDSRGTPGISRQNKSSWRKFHMTNLKAHERGPWELIEFSESRNGCQLGYYTSISDPFFRFPNSLLW